jgi:uncharacterized membrane protein
MVNIIGGLYCLFAVITWSIASIVYKSAMGSVGMEGKEKRDPIASLGVRILIVGVFITLLSILLGDFSSFFTMSPEDGMKYLIITFILGVVTLFGDVCYFNALRFLDVSRIYPLINTQSLFTIPLAYYFFSEDIPSLMWLSSLLMICGVLFVGGKNDSNDKGMQNIEALNRKKNYIKGIFGGIGTGFSFGVQYVLMNMLTRIAGGALECNVARTDMYAIILWIYILITKKHIPRRKTESEKLAFRDYVYTGLVGILSFGIGDSIYQLGVTLNGASISIIIASSAPIFNQILSITVLKEKFRKNFLIGVICIVIGNVLVIF